MKNRRSIFGVIALAVIILFSIAGCDTNDGTGDPAAPEDITVDVRINSSSHDVLRGGKVSFLVRVQGTDKKPVTWSIDEENRHEETQISTNEEGETFLFVSEDETLETLTIRATLNADPEKSDTETVTIPVPVVDKVEILLPQPWVEPWQNKVDVGPSGEIEFTVKVTGKDFIRDAVTWSIDNEDKNQNTTINIDDNGTARLIVAQGETLQTFNVQAVSKWNADKIGEVTVTVKEPVVTGLVILDHDGKVVSGSSQNPKMIKASDSEEFKAIVTGTGKADQGVTWEIERLTYIISVEEIQQDKDGKWTDGWASTQLEIVIDDDTPLVTWVKTGEITELASVYESKPVERISGSKNVKIWVTNYDDDGNIVNEQITLEPTTGTTEIDENGKFTVDGRETFGKFRLIAVSEAEPTMKKEVIVQIDSSSEIGIDPPPEF